MTALRSMPKRCDEVKRVEPPASLDDLILDEGIRRSLLRLARERDRRAELARNNLKPRSKFLFYGPPGNGKTAVAGAVANLLELPFYVANYAEIIDSALGGTEKGVAKPFAAVGETACVLFFDECDSILSSRTTATQSADQARNNAVNLMLTHLDQLAPMVVFIAATNRIDDLDRAAGRRFDAVFEFKAPSFDQKQEFVKRILPRYPVVKASRAGEIVKACDADSYAELEKQVMDLARETILGR